jgi:hypothetical protein
MRFAYADPPYLGCCSLYGHPHQDGCWDDLQTHRNLIAKILRQYPDGWALSSSSSSLHALLPLFSEPPRIAAWVKPFCAFKKGVRPCYAWDPVLFRSDRNPPKQSHHPPEKGGTQTTPKDYLAESITLKKGLTGAKPLKFCEWVLDLLNFQPGDTLIDLFPGTGIMQEAVKARTLPIDMTRLEAAIEKKVGFHALHWYRPWIHWSFSRH